ncbi:hypothetical protein CEXT_716101 [Caerostris extrusa]|uniref:Uncharacterized protein n=1 Tax=Caerostris extrusa TaxID=172846 RepID=A0AAV4Y1K0_CAEEX|nr:hypothetical protein CEXT_716101 [Caerostris extrusa]
MLSLSHGWLHSPTAARLPLSPLSFKKPHSETPPSPCAEYPIHGFLSGEGFRSKSESIKSLSFKVPNSEK